MASREWVGQQVHVYCTDGVFTMCLFLDAEGQLQAVSAVLISLRLRPVPKPYRAHCMGVICCATNHE